MISHSVMAQPVDAHKIPQRFKELAAMDAQMELAMWSSEGSLCQGAQEKDRGFWHKVAFKHFRKSKGHYHDKDNDENFPTPRPFLQL